jgi:uncharacterized protein (DUF849 family)
MVNGHLFVQAALNGNRNHPTVPRMPQELATDAHLVVEAGARSVHLHAYNECGQETLAAKPCALALQAVRAACPGVPISLTTSADVEPNPEKRRALIATWTEVPDLVTANMGEKGILDLCELLIERGIGIEAGLLSLKDAHVFIGSGIAPRCSRPKAKASQYYIGTVVRHDD